MLSFTPQFCPWWVNIYDARCRSQNWIQNAPECSDREKLTMLKFCVVAVSAGAEQDVDRSSPFGFGAEGVTATVKASLCAANEVFAFDALL